MVNRVDVVVVGSGAAGLRAATQAAKGGSEVLVLTKGQTGRSGATVTVTGDISVDGQTMKRVLGLEGDAADSPERFYEDTLRSGQSLNHRGLAEALVTQVGPEVAALVNAGLKIVGVGHAPGHRHPRGVLISGMQVLQLLAKAAIDLGVRFRDEFYACEIIANDEGVCGVAGIDLRTGTVTCIEAKSVILATGGGMMIYPFRTAPEELVGDGYRMAARAGAELVNMEMVQFLPSCLVDPPLWRGIQFPWIIGPQSGTRAWFLNRYGERFMARYDPERMEMSTRDTISIACVREVLEGRGGPNNGIFISWAHLPHNVLDFLPQWYGKPLLRSDWRWEGFDFRELVDRIKAGYAVEVAPASHFFMGGVRIGTACDTAVPGLYACGEVAGGVHGANRLSGNACSQFLVQGAVAGDAASAYAEGRSFIGVSAQRWNGVRDDLMAPLARTNGIAAHEYAPALQDAANKALNVVRNGNDMMSALASVRAMKDEQLVNVFAKTKTPVYNRQWAEAIEASSSTFTVEAIALSALSREESRGAHFRSDFPERDESFLANGVISLKNQTLLHRFDSRIEAK